MEDAKRCQEEGRKKKEREKTRREEEKRRKEMGQRQVCVVCWVGGERGGGTGNGGERVDNGGAERYNSDASNSYENGVELTEMIVRDDDMKEAEI